MRFKIDENLHPDVALSLRYKGHDALGVWDQGLKGKRDEDLARVCRLEGRALLTLDVGFADVRTYPPDQYPGLIVLRLRSCEKMGCHAERSEASAFIFLKTNNCRFFAALRVCDFFQLGRKVAMITKELTALASAKSEKSHRLSE
jgi:predicted nuclease of predicted toxin-antitoxin system